MATPMKNPRKAFNFLITIQNFPELPPFGVQEVDAPSSEVESVEHGYANTVIKTAGIVKPGTLSIRRLISLDPTMNLAGESEAFYWWQKQCQDATSQSGGDPDNYKHPIIVQELANSSFGDLGNVVVKSTFVYTGCWPRLINGREYRRGESNNLVESVEFEVDYVDPGHV